MNHLDEPQFLGLLVVIFGAAKLFGADAKWIWPASGLRRADSWGCPGHVRRRHR